MDTQLKSLLFKIPVGYDYDGKIIIMLMRDDKYSIDML